MTVDVPLGNLVYNRVNKIVKNYKRNHEIDKKIFSRFPPHKLKEIEQVSFSNNHF